MTTAARAQFDLMNQELAALADQLGKYSHEQLNTKAANGGWSAMQCLQHLKLAEVGGLAYVKKKLSFDPKLDNTFGPTEYFQRQFLVYSMHLPIKIKAPKGIGTESIPEESELNAVITEWKQQRTELRSFLAELPEIYWSKKIMKHPFAGRLSLETMLHFFRAHFGRHRRQALRVLKN